MPGAHIVAGAQWQGTAGMPTTPVHNFQAVNYAINYLEGHSSKYSDVVVSQRVHRMSVLRDEEIK